MGRIVEGNMKDTRVKDCYIIELEKIDGHDARGSLSVIEKQVIPFESKRVYYLYDVPSDATRGGHAHKELHQFLIPLSGSFDVILNDSKAQKKYTLNKPNKGLYLCPGIWREIENFSSGAVCLVLASEVYLEEDYIRDFHTFLRLKLPKIQ